MLRASTLVLLLALALPAAAVARSVAPPGYSEADQYYETVPGPAGPRAPDSYKRARDAVRDGAINEATEHALRRRGAVGLAVARGVAQTVPARRSSGSSLLPGILGEPGLGAVFPIALVAAAAAAAAFAVARRRRRLSH